MPHIPDPVSSLLRLLLPKIKREQKEGVIHCLASHAWRLEAERERCNLYWGRWRREEMIIPESHRQDRTTTVLKIESRRTFSPHSLINVIKCPPWHSIECIHNPFLFNPSSFLSRDVFLLCLCHDQFLENATIVAFNAKYLSSLNESAFRNQYGSLSTQKMYLVQSRVSLKATENIGHKNVAN